MQVNTFNEMLEIRDTLQRPILMWENPDETCTKFIIPADTKILYLYQIAMDYYDESLDIVEEKQNDYSKDIKPKQNNNQLKVEKEKVQPKKTEINLELGSNYDKNKYFSRNVYVNEILTENLEGKYNGKRVIIRRPNEEKKNKQKKK